MRTRTSTRLIEDLRDPANDAAWSLFTARYGPILMGFARASGFGPDDSSELTQRSLVEFAAAYQAGRYRRERGRLSAWLLGIARNQALAMRRQHMGAGDQGLSRLEDEAGMEVWEREKQAAILGEAMRQLRHGSQIEEHTLRAFELFAVRGIPAAQVAEMCGIEVDAVYVIKNRLTKKLRDLAQELSDDFDREPG